MITPTNCLMGDLIELYAFAEGRWQAVSSVLSSRKALVLHSSVTCPMLWSVQGRSIIVPRKARRQSGLSDQIACSLSQMRLCYSFRVSLCPESERECFWKYFDFFNRASDWLKYFSRSANFTPRCQVATEIWSTQRLSLWSVMEKESLHPHCDIRVQTWHLSEKRAKFSNALSAFTSHMGVFYPYGARGLIVWVAIYPLWMFFLLSTMESIYQISVKCKIKFLILMIVSREVRNFRAPGNESGSILQQCLDGCWI